VGEIVALGRSDLDFHAGMPVWVSMRPECLSLTHREGPASVNAIAGAIESTVYLGEIAEHRFRTASETLRIYELNPQERPDGRASLLAVIAPADVTLVPGHDDL
jgi:ABC-type Fe3+/spermidine/putrescine transport system ATPase subunit